MVDKKDNGVLVKNKVEHVGELRYSVRLGMCI